MNDQNNNLNPAQPANMANTNPVSPAQPVAPTPPVTPAEPVVSAPVVEPNKDLQALSQDLENLAKEAVATEPTPPADQSASLASSMAEPIVNDSEVVPTAVSTPPVVAPVADVAVPMAKVILYTTAACPFCKAQKDYLKEINMAFTEKNVEEDTEALKEMLNVGDNFAGVPIAVLNGPKGKRVVKGFTKDEFVKELEEAGLKEAEPVKAEVPSQSPAVTTAQTVPTTPTPAPVVPAQPEAPVVPDLN